ncbi:High-affinity nitrate transporter 3.1 [Sesamum alatum]|uniref:High-affinity nitrate transporter n=1 Tax=Sesamum alatum TaxID=300844 RepID=A0AAE1YYN9_9LAMI|nr:High-affinity nitrate transporter 3.1 [Sesamum alatum]
MAVQHFLAASLLLLSCLAPTSHAVTFSSLPRTLVVSASPKQRQVVRAGVDIIMLTWSLNASLPVGTDSGYKTVKLKLCYAPISQKDRAWRKTVDDLDKDKTCQHKIASQTYNSSSSTFTWTLQKDVPTGTYFVRAYVHNSADEAVAYGQTADAQKATNLFDVQAISGRHVSLDIASVCFSTFSVVSLFGFFFLEKRKSKSSQQK